MERRCDILEQIPGAHCSPSNNSGNAHGRSDDLHRPITSFVGREHKIAEVRRLLLASRLVALTGAGGSGKTRLALEVAAQSTGEYADGVWLAELAPLADQALVRNALAVALGPAALARGFSTAEAKR